MRNERIPIGETTDQQVETQIRAGAILIPTPEWVNPYAGLSVEEKAQIMAEVEKPTPPTELEIIED